MTETTASAPADGTSPFVAAQATKPDAIALAEMALVGIAGKPGDMRALFRLARGDIHVVREGDPTRLGQVFEISDAGVVVTKPNGNAIFIPPIPI